MTTITTNYSRKLEVSQGWLGSASKHLTVTDTTEDLRIASILSPEEVKELVESLIGDNATVITDLPEATSYECLGKTIVKSGNTRYYADKDPEYIETFAKEQLAIAKFIREHRAQEEALAKLAAEAEAAKAAEKEAKRVKRRAELVKEFGSVPYTALSFVSKQAFDRIIELEEAQAV